MLMVITQDEYDALEERSGEKICPSGDYRQVKEFAKNANYGYESIFPDGAKLGAGSKFGFGCEFGRGCEFGDGCRIAFGAKIGEGARMGKDVTINE